MSTFIQFVFLGLSAGGVYAMLGTGVVAIYRASGVLNFSHGAVMMVGSFVFYSLYSRSGVPALVALVAATLVATAIGVAIAWLPIRRLRDQSVLTKVIVTVAVLLAVQASGTLIWGGDPVSTGNWITDASFSVGSVTISWINLILVAVAAVLALSLALLSSRTRIGLATTGVAENTRATAALGWSPDLISTVSWGAGAGIAGLAGVLLTPRSGLQVDSLCLLTVPALAVALLANLESYGLALAGGISLGVAQSLMARYVSVSGLAESLPFLAVMLVLVLRGKSLPTRGFVVDRLADFGTGRVRPVVLLPLVIAALVLIQYVMSDDLVYASIQSLGYGVVFLSIVLLVGYAGQLSLGQMALAGMGALIAGRLVATTGVSFVPAALIAVVGTAAIGILFAVPALRTRGAILGVVTLGLAVTISNMVFNSNRYTGGVDGTLVAGKVKLFGIDLDPTVNPRPYALFVLGCFVVCALVVANIRRGRVGRSLVALRANERAAASMGIDVRTCKIYAFMISAGIAGVGGICLAFQQYSIVYSDLFGTFESISVIAFAVIGGIGYIGGTLFAGLFPHGGLGDWSLQEITGGYSQWIPFIGGVGTLLAMMHYPNGAARAFMTVGRVVRRAVMRSSTPASKRVRELPMPERSRVAPATLRAEGITVRFGEQVAVDDVSLTVAPGEIVGLIGPNGAGKTTMIDALTGYVKPEQGEIWLDDRSVTKAPVHVRARAGLSRSFQSLELFEDATVLENLRTASDPRDRVGFVSSLLTTRRRPLPPAAVAAVHDFELLPFLDDLPGELPYGRRRLAAVARSVAASPSILLLDEPAAGVSGVESQELARLIRSLAKDWGIGILLVEHEMRLIMEVCDRIEVLEFGAQIASGTPQEVSNDPAVIRAYLGDAGGAVPAAPSAPAPAPAPAFAAEQRGA